MNFNFEPSKTNWTPPEQLFCTGPRWFRQSNSISSLQKNVEKIILSFLGNFLRLKEKIRKAVFCICITYLRKVHSTYVKGTETKNHLVTPWRSVISWIYTMTRRCFCAQWFHDFFLQIFALIVAVFSFYLTDAIFYCCFQFLTQYAVSSVVSTDSTKNCLLSQGQGVWEKWTNICCDC